MAALFLGRLKSGSPSGSRELHPSLSGLAAAAPHEFCMGGPRKVQNPKVDTAWVTRMPCRLCLENRESAQVHSTL
jgi:hypothetical protein